MNFRQFFPMFHVKHWNLKCLALQQDPVQIRLQA